ncbi:precorrin-6A/cobalt-precorrin-6A reductase [Corynebacterium lowii]|uniref:Cobalt-precorrin-6x reductase n=1 Tax=Corynebacterium lowii TaxID=1544413 RepID=A0A0Q0UGC9_9CORY|nr:precorrin-6A/cobalt-precorrin-6A reductase [Corynebacterium lowii]KQB85736.1 cobalt-precorrin-6x reductase [Corynebacterium lowii]MDP9851038.1 precorrin-6A/cobalt-precorrin-6A reductase [Corynebacterium lowii]
MRMRVLVIVGEAGFPGISHSLTLAGWEVTTALPASPAELAALVVRERIDALVDATHPFDPAHADIAEAAHATGAALVAYSPRRWDIAPQIETSDLAEAARWARLHWHHILVDAEGTGAELVAELAADSDNLYVLRQSQRPRRAEAPARHRVISPQPGDVAGEKKLMRDHQIDGIILSDTGRLDLAPTVEAAAALNIPVALIARPALPGAIIADTPQSVVNAI